MRRQLGLVACAVALLGPSSALSEVGLELLASGDWVLVGVDGFELSLFGEDYVFDEMCVIRTNSVAGGIEIGMFSRSWADVAPEVGGALLGKIDISGAVFPNALHDVTLISGTGTYAITGAEHSGQTVQFLVEAQHAPASALSILTMMAGADLRVESEAFTEAVVFSSDGFVDVTKALLDCAGVD